MGYSGAGGKLIHEKTRREKSRDTVPLSTHDRKFLLNTWLFIDAEYSISVSAH